MIELHKDDVISVDASFMLSVVLKQSDEMIGEIVVMPEDGTISMGYTFHYNYHRKGYACEALTALINLLHERYPSWEFISFTEPENEPSMALLKKLGYKDMGYLPNMESQVFGKWTTPTTEAELAQLTSKAIVIKTDRLTIRHIVADDWKSIKEIWVDFNTSALSQYDKPHITDDADVQPRIAKWAAANSGTEHMFFAVCLDDTVIGYIAFNIRENGHEIGYCFHSAYHGKGYAKESHLALIDYMRELGIKRLTAGTALNNTPSVVLLKSLGIELIETEKVSFYKDADGNDIVFDGGVFELAL